MGIPMMNDLILYIYLIDVLTSLNNSIGLALFIFFACLLVVCLAIALDTCGKGWDKAKPFLNKAYKPTLIVFCVLVLLKIVIPSTQTMYIALGLHTANQVMQQPQIAQVGNQAMRILQAKLDEYEKELTQENKGEVKND